MLVQMYTKWKVSMNDKIYLNKNRNTKTKNKIVNIN